MDNIYRLGNHLKSVQKIIQEYNTWEQLDTPKNGTHKIITLSHPVARAAPMLGEDHFATSWISGMAPKWVKDSGNGPQMIPPTAPD